MKSLREMLTRGNNPSGGKSARRFTFTHTNKFKIRLKKKSQLVLVFLLLCNSLIAIVAAEQAFAGTFGGSSSVDVTANATALALADLTLTDTSQNYAGGSATFAITSPAATEILSLKTVGSANTTLNAISVVGSTVFRGTGSGSTVIGAVDGTLDGTAGKNLKINFTNSFVNGGFSDATVVSSVGSIVTLNGWTVYLQRAYLAGGGLTPTTIAGWPAPADNAFPAYLATPAPYDRTAISSGNTFSYSNTFPRSGYGNSLKLQLDNGACATGYCIIRGPYVVSNSAVYLTSADSVSLSWYSIGANDAYDAFGYLVNTETGATIQLLNATGASASESRPWGTTTVAMNGVSGFSAGNYKYVFINGTWDASGGRAEGAYLAIDDVSVSNSAPTLTVSSADLQGVARLLQYKNATNSPLSATRTLGISTTLSETGSKTINVANPISLSGTSSTLNLNVGVAGIDTVTATSGTGTKTFALTGTSNAGITLDTSQSNKAILNVAGSVLSGTYYETVTATDSANATAVFPITVTLTKSNQATLTINSATSVTYGETLTMTTTGGSGTGGVTFSVSSGTCTISGTTLTVGAVGSTCVISAYKTYTDYYFGIYSTNTPTISIVRARPTLSLIYPNSNTVTYSSGGTLTPSTATRSGDGAITYSTPSSASVCTINSSTGVITTAGAGSCSAVMNVAQGTNYLALSETATVTINLATLARPSAPVGYAVSGSSTSETVTIGTVSGASSYTLRAYLATDTSTVISGGTIAPFSSAGTVSGLLPGTGYQFTVTAIGDGISWNNSAASPFSATVTTNKVNMDPPTVTATATANTPKSITVSWNAIPYRSMYRVNLYSSPGGGLLISSTGYTETSTIINTSLWSGLLGGTAYKVSVTAIGGSQSNDSAESTLASVTTLDVPAIAPTISSQPANTNKSVGQTATFSVGITANDSGTVTYQWQVYSSSTWSNLSGETSNAYTTGALSIADNGKKYRVVILNTKSDNTTATVTSDGNATLSVTQTTLTTPTIVCSGAYTCSPTTNLTRSVTVGFAGVPNASSYTARIYLASDTSTALQTITGFTSGNAIGSLTANTGYKVTITAVGDGVSYSNSAASSFSATITTNPNPTTPTVATPSAANKNVGQTASFSSSATVSDGGTLTYQWQVSTDSGSTWTDISGATAVDYTTGTLAIGDNAKRYRMGAINSKYDTSTTAYSVAATLSVSQTTLATPSTPTGVATTGSTVSTTITYSGVPNASSYTARIYLASDTSTALQTITGFTSGNAIGSLTANTGYKVTITAVGDGVSYSNSAASSFSATITTNPNPTTPTVATPSAANKNVGQTASFSSSATVSDGGTLTYQWQVSTDSGSTWTDISGATAVDYTTGTLAIGDNAKRYRMGAINSKYDTSTTAYSVAATLSVSQTTLATPSTPTGVATTGSTVSTTITYSGVPNASSYTARIYLASDTSTALQTITGFTSGNAIGSLTANTGYKVTITAVGDGVSYSNSAASSFSATITTNPNPTTPTVATPSAANKNVGQTASFSSSATVSDGGTLTYQWQVSTDSGSTWTDISGATAVDYTTGTLAIGDNAKRYRMGAINSKYDTSTTAYSVAATLSVSQTTLATPNTPTGVATTNVSTSIDVTFSGVPNASSYTARIYLASDTSTALQTITGFTSGNAIGSLTANTGYKVTITAVGDGVSYSNSAASSFSATITTNPAADLPRVATPASATKTVDQTYTLRSSATVGDGGTLTYQWQISTDSATTWSDISGATAVDYTTDAFTQVGDVQYRLEVTNSKNGTQVINDSIPAVITVIQATLNTPSTPTGVATTGSTVSTTITYSGVPNASSYTADIYLASDTSTALQTITGFTSGNAIGSLTANTGYKVTITAIGDDATYKSSLASSFSATITTNPNPTTPTVATPSAANKNVGQTASFSSSATVSDGGTLTYQWQVSTDSGSTWTDISGATAVDYTTGTLAIGDNAKRYRMGAINSKYDTSTTAYSVAATLSVSQTTLATPSTPTGVATTGSTVSTTITYSGVPNASSYTARIYLASDTSTALQTITGFTSGNAIGSLTANTGYKVTITAIGDDATYKSSLASSFSATITTNPNPTTPTVATPSAANKNVGQTASFSSSATVSDGGTLTYQWQVSTDSGSTWTDISGATAVDYTTGTLAIGDNAKRYRMGAINSKYDTSTTAYSVAATLSVSQTTLATPSTPTGVATTGSTVSTTITYSGVPNASSYTARIYLASDTSTALQTITGFTSGNAIGSLTANTGYKVTITAVGDGVSYSNSAASSFSATITTNPNPTTPTVATPSAANKNVGQTASFSSSATVSDGGTLTYQWQVSTDSGSTWTDISGATAVDYTTGTLAIGDNAKRYRMGAINSKYDTSTTAYSVAATLSVSQTTLATPSTPTGVATTGSTVSTTITYSGVPNASSYTADIYLASDTSTALQTITGFTSGNAIGSLTANTGYKVTITAVGDGVSYSNSAASSFSATITTNPNPTTPTVATPSAANKNVGQTASFSSSATVSDGGTLTYQWQVSTDSGSTWTDISGATAVDYTTGTLAIGDNAKRYRMGAINSKYDTSTTAYSVAATLSVSSLVPSIGSQPASVSKRANQTATFSVSASSGAGTALSYQWQVNAGSSWANVSSGSGGTTNSYTTAALPIGANGYQYRVVVTNTFDGVETSVNSSTATLTVTKATQSALAVASQDGVVGTPLTLVTSGGSSGEAVSYEVENGTATGCLVTSGVLIVGTAGTCRITATMAGNATYDSISSSVTPVTFALTSRSVAVTVTSSPVYQSSNQITVSVGTAGKVNFLQNGRTIPGCGEVKASLTSAATCSWKPSTLGYVEISAEITPTNTSIPVTQSVGIPVRVIQR